VSKARTIRGYAAGMGVAEPQAIQAGMANKAEEFRQGLGTVYNDA